MCAGSNNYELAVPEFLDENIVMYGE